MQIMGVTGKIYNLKCSQTSNGKDKCTFRVSVRKQFVSDQDKQNNTTNVFIPCMAMGPTAKFISDYFKDGDFVAIGDMEYQTWKSDSNQQYDDVHMFKVNKAGFCGGADAGNGGGGGARQQGGNQRPAANQQRQQQQRQNTQRQEQTRRQQAQAMDNDIDTSYDLNDDDLPF